MKVVVLVEEQRGGTWSDLGGKPERRRPKFKWQDLRAENVQPFFAHELAMRGLGLLQQELAWNKTDLNYTPEQRTPGF